MKKVYKVSHSKNKYLVPLRIFIEKLLLIIGCSVMPFFLAVLITWAGEKIFDLNEYPFAFLFALAFILPLPFSIWALIQQPKVILDDEKITIVRPGPLRNYTIYYGEITEIEWIVDFIDYDKNIAHLYYIGVNTMFFDFNSTILIHTKRHIKTNFAVSLKNADDFCKNVIEAVNRLDFLKSLNIDELLVKNNLEYKDLRLRWKAEKQLDAVCYMDENNEEQILIEY